MEEEERKRGKEVREIFCFSIHYDWTPLIIERFSLYLSKICPLKIQFYKYLLTDYCVQIEQFWL